MANESLLKKVIRVVAEETGCDESTICHETILENLDIDYLDFLALMQVLSATFWDVPVSRYIGILTVGDIVKALEACAPC